MITHITGKLVDSFPTHAVLETNGVGFEVLIPLSTYERLGSRNETATLLTYLHVREDALVLYGFINQDERDLFLDLISVSGIGPKLALVIISGAGVNEIYQHIAEGNETLLTRIKGLGKKTAQRLILDLGDRAQDKLKGSGVHPIASEGPGATILEQAVSALMSLGYSKKEAEEGIGKAAQRVGENPTVEDMIRLVLSGEPK